MSLRRVCMRSTRLGLGMGMESGARVFRADLLVAAVRVVVVQIRARALSSTGCRGRGLERLARVRGDRVGHRVVVGGGRAWRERRDRDVGEDLARGAAEAAGAATGRGDGDGSVRGCRGRVERGERGERGRERRGRYLIGEEGQVRRVRDGGGAGRRTGEREAYAHGGACDEHRGDLVVGGAIWRRSRDGARGSARGVGKRLRRAGMYRVAFSGVGEGPCQRILRAGWVVRRTRRTAWASGKAPWEIGGRERGRGVVRGTGIEVGWGVRVGGRVGVGIGQVNDGGGEHARVLLPGGRFWRRETGDKKLSCGRGRSGWLGKRISVSK